MNQEVYRSLPGHVQREIDNRDELIACMERALQLCVPRLREVDPLVLPGQPPPPGAPEHEWVEYLIVQGGIVFHEQLFAAAA